jgi:hypothetical protein
MFGEPRILFVLKLFFPIFRPIVSTPYPSFAKESKRESASFFCSQLAALVLSIVLSIKFDASDLN